jgi:hypothetical protein
MSEVAVGALVTAIFGGVVVILNALHKNGQEKKAAQFTEQGLIIDRQEKQISRLDAQIQDLQKLLIMLQAEHARCREETAELRTYQSVLYEYAKSQHMALKSAGITVVDLPAPPPIRSHKEVDVGFLVRSAQQNTELLKATDEKLLGAA